MGPAAVQGTNESVPYSELTDLLPNVLVELFYLDRKKCRQDELLTGVPQDSVGRTRARALTKLRDRIGESRKEMYAIRDEP